MTGLLTLKRPVHNEGNVASSAQMNQSQRATSLPPKRSASAAKVHRAMLHSLDHSDRLGSGKSGDEDVISANEPTWFSQAFHGSNDPVSNNEDDENSCCSMESMELASGSDFRLRPTTTALGSRIDNNRKHNMNTSSNQASISSITLGSHLIQSTKFVPSLRSRKDVKDCEESVISHSNMSEGSHASSLLKDEQKGGISKRTRGRSLGLPFKTKNKDRKGVDEDDAKDGSAADLETSTGQKQHLDKHQSKKSHADINNKDDRKKELRGRSLSSRNRTRQRDRSRSIVSDMRSFICSMDGSSGCDEKSATLTASSAVSKKTSSGSADVNINVSDRTGVTCRSSSFSDNSTPPTSPSISLSSRVLKAEKGSFFNWNKVKDSDHGDQSEQQLIRALHETNLKNERTIEHLREELADLINERNAFRNNSERLMEVMTRQKEELQNEIHNERTGFATITQCQKREIDVWRQKANKMYKKVKMLDAQARERERVLQRYHEDLGMEGMMEREERLRTLERDIDRILNKDNAGSNDSSFKSYESVGTSSLPSISDMEQRFSSMAAKYEAQIKYLESQSKTHQLEANSWKEKFEEIQDEKDDEVAMVRVLENKLSGCKIVIEAMKEDDESVVTSVNDELVAKLGDLAEENGSLLSRCQRLERELEAAKSKEVDGRKLVAASKASIEEVTRKMELAQQRNEESLSTILSLRSENKKLRECLSGDSKQSKKLVHKLRRSLEGASVPSDDKAVAATCQVSGNEEDLYTIEEIKAENEALHESLEGAIKLAEQMKGKMNAFVKTHDATIKDYEEKLSRLGAELKHGKISNDSLETSLVVSSIRYDDKLSADERGEEKKEMMTIINALKLENNNFRVSIKEMSRLVETAEADRLSFEKDLLNQNETVQFLREEIKNVSTEREDAYETCKVLQQEINMLRQSVSDSKERTETLMSLTGDDDDSSNGNKEKIDALMKANDHLNKELKQKNEALEAVRTVLENLKEDQATIKRTVVALRQENAKLKQGLKDDGADPSRTTPPPPSRGRSKTPPPPKKRTSNDSSDNVKVSELESKVKRVENENKGLRDANSTLSAKLFDEMEKTDALRVANDGLAARICKLVTFIQENQKLVPTSGSGTTSTKSSKNPVVTPSHHSITLKTNSSNPVVTPMPMKTKKSRHGS